MGQVHTHQIHVQTEDELVTVQIGGEGSVPGGFAKLFNRVVDSEAWARLSDAGRAAYIPLVRFADQRNQFRIQMGQAALMKYAGLSRSSIKRAIKDLLASRLIVLVEQGGVTPDGRNESNLYQLMVPVDPKPKMIGGQQPRAGDEPAVIHQPSSVVTPRGPESNPLPVRHGTGGRFAAGPPVGPGKDPSSVPVRTAGPAQRTPGGRSTSGPQYRSISDSEDISRPARRAPSASAPSSSEKTKPLSATADAAVFLEENGVEGPVARQLAAVYPMQRVIDVVETMQYRRARGKCENPGGFIRDALVKQWQTPQAVIDARAKAQARARAQVEQAQTRKQAAAEVGSVDAEQRKIDQLIAALDDDELDVLAMEVLKKYDGNSAVLAVLTRKPARESLLMRMEIAGMLGGR